jgi:hypothetical protein
VADKASQPRPLEQYATGFCDNAISAAVLPELTEADLETLGVVLLGHRKKPLRVIAALPTETGPSARAGWSRHPRVSAR